MSEWKPYRFPFQTSPFQTRPESTAKYNTIVEPKQNQVWNCVERYPSLYNIYERYELYTMQKATIVGRRKNSSLLNLSEIIFLSHKSFFSMKPSPPPSQGRSWRLNWSTSQLVLHEVLPASESRAGLALELSWPAFFPHEVLVVSESRAVLALELIGKSSPFHEVIVPS